MTDLLVKKKGVFLVRHPTVELFYYEALVNPDTTINLMNYSRELFFLTLLNWMNNFS